MSGNVDNDLNVRFICKRHCSPMSSFFSRNAPLIYFPGKTLVVFF